jgi:hypothetical protein
VPQFLPAEAQVLGVQVRHLLLVHTLPPVHVPQSYVMSALQWFVILPHSAPAEAHSRGTVVPTVGQGHVMTPPQPLESVPQVVAG